MKKIILILALLPVFGTAQTNYEKGMQKAMDLRASGKPWEAANLFERIAKAEPEKWLPPYYVAQINIIQSFGEKDEAKLTAQLKKARDFINEAKFNATDNPEIMILDAQWYTAWIVFDGQQYGMTYSGKASELYEKALKLAPNNPRVILAKAEWDMGSARYFGQSLEPYCKDVQKAIELFADFKPKEKFYPTYGLERAHEILKNNCGAQTGK